MYAQQYLGTTKPESRQKMAEFWLKDKNTKKTPEEKEALKFFIKNPNKWEYVGIPENIAKEAGLVTDFIADEDERLTEAIHMIEDAKRTRLLIAGKYPAATEKDHDSIIKLVENKGECVLEECKRLISLGMADDGLTAIMVAEAVKKRYKTVRKKQYVPATSDMAGYNEFKPILFSTGCTRPPYVEELNDFNGLVERHGLKTAINIIRESIKEYSFTGFVNFKLIIAHEQKYLDKVKEIESLKADEPKTNEATVEDKDVDDKAVMKSLLQKALTLSVNSFESRPYQKLAFENISAALNGSARACELPLSVGFGKTYLTPIISMLSNIMGHPFVYTCYSKATLYDAMQEARNLRKTLEENYRNEFTVQEWITLGKFFENGKGLLFIPSRLDGVRQFFLNAGFIDKPDNKADNKNQDDNDEDPTEHEAGQKLLSECLAPVNIKDGDEFYNVLNDFRQREYESIREEWSKAKKNEARGRNDIISSAKKLWHVWHTMKTALKSMTFGKGYEKEAAEKKAEECEMILRNFLELLCKNQFNDDVIAMSHKYKWLSKLYPGVLTREAYSIYVTFAKMAHPMEPFGYYRDTKLTSAKDDSYKGEFTVFMDESDMFCHRMISQKAEEAVKYSINIEDFVTKTHHVLSSYLYTEKRTVKNENGEDEIICINKNRIPPHLLSKVSDRKKYIKKMYSVKQKLDEFMKDHDYLLDSSDTASDTFTTKLFRNENDKVDMPILNVSGDRAEFISGLPKDEKGNIKEGYQYYSFVMKDNCLVKIYCGKKEENEDKEPFTKYYRELTSLSNTIIGMFRYIVDEKMTDMLKAVNDNDDNEDSTSEAGYTRTEEIRSILDLFKYSEKQRKFVEINMLHPRNDTVESTSFYAQGFSIITMMESPEHHYSTYISATRIMKLPDYDIANLIYNSYFVILASGTGSMASLQNVDIRYVEDAVTEKMKEDLIQMTGCDDEEQLSVTPVFAEMPDLEEAGRLLKEHQKENIAKDIRKEICIYEREADPSKTGCAADLAHYEEATGRKLDSGYLNYDEKGKVDSANAIEVGNFCYAVWALSKMCESNAHTGLIYLNVLPGTDDGKKSVFNIDNLTKAAKYVAEKYNLDPAKCQIKRLDSKGTAAMKRELENGISDDEYFLWCSQVAATGAGFSPYYYKKDSYNTVDMGIKYDVDSIFLGNLTNIIAGNDDVEAPLEKKLTIAIEAEYHTTKFAKLETYKNKAYGAMCYRQQNRILDRIFKGDNRFRRNLCLEDPQSPFCLTVGARILQEFARIDRGHQKNGVVLMSVSSDLIEKSGISRDIYEGVPTTYLFDSLIDHIEAYKQEHPKKVLGNEDDLREAHRYVEKNRDFYKTIQNILSRISKAKKNNEPVPKSTLDSYEYYRECALSMGYQFNGAILPPDGYFLPKISSESELKGTNQLWHTMLGNEDNDYDKQNNAFITREPVKGSELKADRFIEAMNFYKRCGLFGKGWEDLFKVYVKYKTEIKEKGFRYPIMTEAYYMLLGIFYENAFKAMSLPGGCYYTGYRLKDLDRTQTEDADMMYEGTRVFLDIKGYLESHKAPDYEKLEEKAERYSGEGKPLFVVLNASPTFNAPDGDKEVIHYEKFDLYVINGIGGINESPVTISERVSSRRQNLERLCEKYKD